jgi:hypothetical protein
MRRPLPHPSPPLRKGRGQEFRIDSLSAEADAPRWRSLRFALTETLRERVEGSQR